MWEFPVPVSDHVPDGGAGVLEVHDEVAGVLAYPCGGGVGGCAEDANAAGGVVDDCQGVEALSGQGDGFEEVARQDRLGLIAEEGGPGGGGSEWCGVDPGVFQDLPDGGRRYFDAECGQFAVDAPVAPSWVFVGQALHESSDRGECPWSAWAFGPTAVRVMCRGSRAVAVALPLTVVVR